MAGEEVKGRGRLSGTRGQEFPIVSVASRVASLHRLSFSLPHAHCHPRGGYCTRLSEGV